MAKPKLELSNRQISNLMTGLALLSRYDTPIMMGMIIANCMETLKPLNEAYENAFKSLKDKHVKTDENGDYITREDSKEFVFKSKKDKDKFIEDRNELDTKEYEVEFFDLITTDMLEELAKREFIDEEGEVTSVESRINGQIIVLLHPMLNYKKSKNKK